MTLLGKYSSKIRLNPKFSTCRQILIEQISNAYSYSIEQKIFNFDFVWFELRTLIEIVISGIAPIDNCMLCARFPIYLWNEIKSVTKKCSVCCLYDKYSARKQIPDTKITRHTDQDPVLDLLIILDQS